MPVREVFSRRHLNTRKAAPMKAPMPTQEQWEAAWRICSRLEALNQEILSAQRLGMYVELERAPRHDAVYIVKTCEARAAVLPMKPTTVPATVR